MRKVFRFPIVLTDHVFDKVRAIDLTLAEFEELLDSGVIIEERALSSEALKELVLLLEWTLATAHRGDRRRATA